jgi:hypothetical protein
VVGETSVDEEATLDRGATVDKAAGDETAVGEGAARKWEQTTQRQWATKPGLE